MSDNFWENVNQYRKLGFDPLRWIPTCSSEVANSVLKRAIGAVKKTSIHISPNWFDSFYYIEGKTPELTRRVYSFTNPSVDRQVEVKRALAIFRVHTGIGEHPQLLAASLQNFLKSFSTKVSVSCISTTLTEHQDGQFGMLDYIELHRGDKVGYMPSVTSTTQVTDVTRAPDAEIHSSIAMTSAIELLNLLGCGIPSSFKLFPVYDAPSEEMLDRIRSNLDAFTSRYNLAMEDYSALKIGKLFYGTSAVASTTKELPVKYDQIEEGMEIIVTNEFGGLLAMSLHALALMDDENISRFEQSNISFATITEARDVAIKNLSEPHFALGKIIAKYCPDYGSEFDKGSHIAAVHPVGAQGILALASLAEVANLRIEINELPIRYPEIAKLASSSFLVENATASLNRCHLIVARRDVANLIIEDLGKHNFAPQRIGFVAGKGTASVRLPQEAGQYIASRARLARLEGSAQ
ncbi:MAG TPA: SelD-related putative sulfur metabolism protein [Nitrososphaera sp.]|nr:SelD-related putative sulfur metabolism protein [Nitrososphaera sp.]